MVLILCLSACAEQPPRATKAETQSPETQAAAPSAATTTPESTVPAQTTLWIPDSPVTPKVVSQSNDHMDVPFIDMPSVNGIGDINREITEVYRDPYKQFKYVKYVWYTSEDVLTLCITSMPDYPGDAIREEYRIYSISIGECRAMTDEEVLAAAQTDPAEFRQAALTAMQNAFFAENEGVDDETALAAMEITQTVLLESVQPFIGEDGLLWVKCSVATVAGQGSHEVLLPVTELTLTPAYQQWLDKQTGE